MRADWTHELHRLQKYRSCLFPLRANSDHKPGSSWPVLPLSVPLPDDELVVVVVSICISAAGALTNATVLQNADQHTPRSYTSS